MKQDTPHQTANDSPSTLAARLEAWAGHWSIPILLALTFLGFNAIGLDRSPLPFWDETVISSAAHSLAFRGKLSVPGLRGSAIGADSHYFLYPPGHALLLAGVYKAFGFGIWQTRLVGVTFGALGLSLLYVATRRLTGSALAGLAAGALLWGDHGWIYNSRLGRMDTMAMALVLGGLVVLLYAGRKEQASLPQRLLVAVSGLLGGMAVMTGPRSAFAVLGVGVVLLVAPGFGGTRERLKSLALFSAGVVLPALGWLPYILSAPDAFRAQFIPHVKGSSLFGAAAPYLPGRGLALLPLLPYSLVFIGGTIFACSRPSLRTPYGLAVLALLLAVAPLLTTPQRARTFVCFFPILAIAGGGLVAYLLKHIKARRSAIVSYALAAVILAVLVLPAPMTRLAIVAAQWESRSYQQVKRALTTYLEHPCTVAGPPFVFYSAVERGCDYRHPRFFLVFPPKELALNQEEYRRALAQWRPRYLILDERDTPLEQVLPQEVAREYQRVGSITIGKPRHRLVERLGEGARPIVATVYRREGE